jgi:hypothetical protein
MRIGVALGALALAASCASLDRAPLGSACAQLPEGAACLVAGSGRPAQAGGTIEAAVGLFQHGARGLLLPGQIHLRVGQRALWPAQLTGLRARGEALGEDWTPPLAAAVVYLWARGSTPPGVKAGITGLADSLPPGARVCPKSYGQHYYEAACLPAGRIAAGDLVDSQHPGQFVHVLQATRQALRELEGLARFLVDDGQRPIKWMVLVTDGRDHEQGTEGAAAERATRAGFAALGTTLREAGVFLQVVSFPCPGDRPACADNVRALVQTAGAAHLLAHDDQQVEEAIRRASLAWSEMKWLQVQVPWYVRLLAGRAPVSVAAQVGGQLLQAPLGTVPLPVPGDRLWYLGVLALALTGVTVLRLRRRAARVGMRPDRHGFPQPFVDAVVRSLDQGVAPPRAAAQLRSLFPLEMGGWKRAYRRRLRGAHPTLASAAGKDWLDELGRAAQGATTAAAAPAGGDGKLYNILSDAIFEGISPRRISRRVRVMLPDVAWSRFAAASRRELEADLEVHERQWPELRSARARELVHETQHELREDVARAVTVAWLAVASGATPGRTLRLLIPRTLLGTAPEAELRLSDPGVVSRHAEIVCLRGRFLLRPLEGAVTLDGEMLTAERRLADGDTIGLGTAQLVFRVVSEGLKRPLDP